MRLPEYIHEIVLARLAEEIKPEQDVLLQQWLKESEQNRREYREFCALWYSARWGSRRNNVDRNTGWERITRDYRKRKIRRLLIPVAVAASVVLTIGIFWIYQPGEKRMHVVKNKSVWNKAEVTLVLSSGDSLRVKGMRETKIQEGGTVIHSDSSGLEYLKDETANLKEVAYNKLIVPRCGEFRLRLADGSLVIMNSESRLRYPVEFSGEQREVYLEGEACFEVAKDTARPFVVHTANASVCVLGTLFNISAYDEEDNTEVTLVNGKVRVNVGDVEKLLAPDEQLVLNNETADVEIRDVESLDYIAWTCGLFRFDAMPLRQLMMKLERWYDISYEFKDEALENIRFTGGFRKYDDIHLIVDMIKEITDVAFKIEGNKVIIDKK
mgnify:CR=1 FL=1